MAGSKIFRGLGKKLFSLTKALAKVCAKKRMFLGAEQTIDCSLVCCGVSIVRCLFDRLYYPSATPRNTKKDAEFIYLWKAHVVCITDAKAD